MNQQDIDKTLNAILKEIELPSSAEDTARRRLDDIGNWLNRKESTMAKFEPFLYNQGSFRLGTTIRPISNEDDYDLDISCKLQEGANRNNITQKNLRDMLHKELQEYAKAYHIDHNVTEKNRCCRLTYKDGMGFHLDVVPCIPAHHDWPQYKFSGYLKGFSVDLTAETLKKYHEVFITDRTLPSYDKISDNWILSNTEGYALWFEEQSAKIKDPAVVKAANVADFKQASRSRLQDIVKLFKRHRDAYFSDEKKRPISMIVTTLAAHAYIPGLNREDSITQILNTMQAFVGEHSPYVPNPVNADEDFAEKWDKEPELKLWFENWLVQARSDFRTLFSCDSQNELEKILKDTFAIRHYSNVSKDVFPAESKPCEQYQGIHTVHIKSALKTHCSTSNA